MSTGAVLARGTQTIPERLAREGYRFDFYQAVRLLEMLAQLRLQSRAASPATGVEPSLEPARFRSRVTLGFPASDIHEIRFTDQNAPPEVTVNFMGLAGALGPLPMPLTEMILANSGGGLEVDSNGEPRRRPGPAADFLDIFNHRLISLMYRVRQTHRPALSAKPPAEGLVARCLLALIGLGHEHLRNRLKTPDGALLLYSGILARRPRSAAGLQRVATDYFGVAVKIRQFVGRWRKLDRDQWTFVGGKRRQNVRLGTNTVIGTRVWDEQTHVRIRLGPMPRTKYFAMLPGGSAHEALRDLIRFYLDPEISFSLALVLDKKEIPDAPLGGDHVRLGFATWLSPADLLERDPVVRIDQDY